MTAPRRRVPAGRTPRDAPPPTPAADPAGDPTPPVDAAGDPTPPVDAAGDPGGVRRMRAPTGTVVTAPTHLADQLAEQGWEPV